MFSNLSFLPLQKFYQTSYIVNLRNLYRASNKKLDKIACQRHFKACFIRQILVTSNRIKTIDHEVSDLI